MVDSLISLPSPATILDRFRSGIGAWLVGTFLSAVLVGTLLQQAFRYFRLYPGDPKYMKAWVITAVTLQLISTALAMHTAYYYLVTYALNPLVFTKPDVWSADVGSIVGSLGNLVAESFFARRVYMIGPRYRIVVMSSMILITASCAISAHALSQPDIVTSTTSGRIWLPTTGSALLLAGDLQLTAVLVYFLHKSRTGVRRTNSMIDLLIAYTISSGTLVCVLNVVSLIMSLVYQHNVVFAASTLVVEAVYTNSFVVALNTRQFVRSRGELDETTLDSGFVLGAKPSDNPMNQVALQSIVFAVGPSQSTDMESGDDSPSKPGSIPRQ
ncbi:hypothetical protein ONZ51_g5637 [Trametes cubensis]|uniref:DUF6534 domain-containing protein n=1 Tax=Trametes cubensis TaxID=1111947 RepID=A0AAD7XBX8_9APHY|nr:hypothetical protein ONZ51_g5637 [Trametes cubensis]